MIDRGAQGLEVLKLSPSLFLTHANLGTMRIIRDANSGPAFYRFE